ncbi:putative complexin-1 [Trichinella zimbabwensis]|uniref:Putative complexin-1 n=1 Tax=Trichinella zimbabwensis TaxID=268475 RepID=A0A0V1HN32_9BILA|nr:putative complexin-1 [Trichinella zimbabwensis]
MAHFLLLTILLHHTISTTLSTAFHSLDQQEEQNLKVKRSRGDNIGHYLQSLLNKLDISKSLKYVPENVGASWDARHQFGPLDFENSNNVQLNFNQGKLQSKKVFGIVGILEQTRISSVDLKKLQFEKNEEICIGRLFLGKGLCFINGNLFGKKYLFPSKHAFLSVTKSIAATAMNVIVGSVLGNPLSGGLDKLTGDETEEKKNVIEDTEILKAREEAEKRRKQKHEKREIEREKLRQEIRGKYKIEVKKTEPEIQDFAGRVGATHKTAEQLAEEGIEDESFGAQINGIVTKAKSSFENITTIIKSFMSFET